MTTVTMNTESKLYHVLQNQVTGSDKKLMMSLLKHMTTDMNILTVNGDTLTSIMKDTGMSESHVRNSLSKLSKLGLIESSRLLRSEYIINPSLGYKGNEYEVWKMYSMYEEQRKAK